MTTALVTGATAGLGAAFARALASEGHDLVLVARDQQGLHAASEALRQRFGVGATPLSADLTTAEGCDRVASRLTADDAPIDVLVNNAGIGLYRPFGTAPLEAEERMLDLNVRAVLRLTYAALPVMTARGRGQIVNVSSVAGFVPRPGNATYSASKAWVTLFSEALSLQVAGTGVRVTAVCPGFTRTEFHDRAQADMSGIPSWMWLDADTVATAGLADARRGKPVSVPSLTYKALLGVARAVPRPVLRQVMRRQGR